MGPRRFSPAGLALVALAFGLFADVARASERLPIIVTYELERRHDAERVERRDPREYWVRQIMARLEDKKPSGTIGLKQPATVQVSFSVARDGTIVSKTIAKSSGSPVADLEALAMLERAQPFPSMPAAMTEPALSFILPLRFR